MAPHRPKPRRAKGKNSARKDHAVYASLSSNQIVKEPMETHRKNRRRKHSGQAALHIRVFEETDQTGKQPANQSTLYGKPRTERKSQTKDFWRTKPASRRTKRSPPSRSNPYGPARSKPQARTTSPNRKRRNPRPNRQIQPSRQGNQQQGQSHRSQ